jgi:hypothetical protein
MSIRLVAAVLLLALASSSVGAAKAESADTDPYVSTPRYNKFPWEFTADYAFVFSVSPAWKQPINPASWVGKPVLPGELHATGSTPSCSLYCQMHSTQSDDEEHMYMY